MADTSDVEPGCTNFAGLSHGDLKKMLDTASSGSLGGDAEVWRRARDTLVEIADVLGAATSGATRTWEGETSSAFQDHMTGLAKQMRETADSADNAYQALVMSADAIDRAKGEMPEEPSVADRGLDLLGDGRFFGDDGGAAEKLQEKMASGKSREDAAAELEGDLSEAESRRQKAIVVMQTLSLRYAEARPLLKPPKTYRSREPIEDFPTSDSDPSGAVASSAAAMGVGAGVAAADVRDRSAADRNASNSRQAGGSADSSSRSPKPLESPAKGGPGTTIDSAGKGPDSARAPAVGTPAIKTVAPSNGVVDGTAAMGRLPNGIVPGGTRMPTPPGGGPSHRGAQGRANSGGSRQSMSRPMVPGVAAGGISGGRLVPGPNRGTTAKRPGGVVGEEPRSRGGNRTFTPGGSGLAGGQRGHHPYGPHGVPRAGSATSRDEEDERRTRPDYLVEDEETWVPDRPVNPRVVE